MDPKKYETKIVTKRPFVEISIQSKMGVRLGQILLTQSGAREYITEVASKLNTIPDQIVRVVGVFVKKTARGRGYGLALYLEALKYLKGKMASQRYASLA